MRVLLINQFSIPDTAATGQLLADVAETLADEGHEVHVICSRRRYGSGTDGCAAREIVNGVNVHRVEATGFGRGKAVGRLLDWFSFYLLAMWRALRLPKMDVCVALTTPPFISLIGLLLSKLKGTRSVIWAMDLYPDIAVAYEVLRRESLTYRLLTRLNRFLYRNAAAVISLGEVMTDRLHSLGVPSDKVHTVHNWVPGEVGYASAGRPVKQSDSSL
jgi:colanic acid biosynthesis glycosyl transferase WcaI